MRCHMSLNFSVNHRVQLCLRQDFTYKRSQWSINSLDVQQRIVHQAHPETSTVLLTAATQIPRSLLYRNHAIIFFVIQFCRFRHMTNSALERHVLHKERHMLIFATFQQNILACDLDNFTDNFVQRSIFDIHRQSIVAAFNTETFLRGLRRLRSLFDVFTNMNRATIDRVIVAIPLQQQTQSIFKRLIIEIHRYRTAHIRS